jgi:acetyl-CoA synthetase
VSKDDPVKGESIVIFARLREGSSPSTSLKEELAKHLGKVVGPIAVPDEIYFAAKLPKTRSGKVMRRILKSVANNTSIGDLTTLEDESSVEEIVKAYQELKGGERKKE